MRFTDPLTENREFRRLYASKKNVVCPYFVLYCRKNRLGKNRLGLTVSTKLGNAVKRNRIRRRLKEVYRLNENHLLPAFDLVMVARGRAGDAPFSKMERAFLQAAETLGMRGTGVRGQERACGGPDRPPCAQTAAKTGGGESPCG